MKPVSDSVRAQAQGTGAQRKTERVRLICPNCLEHASFSDLLYISQHDVLRGDSVLGPDAWCRFLPSRFNAAGKALDAFDGPCDRLACPHCRLELDRALVSATPAFFSIIGAPSSGKSYFLGSMVWELRRLMPQRFGLTFGDVDLTNNRVLNGYEERLFLADQPDRLVYLDKTHPRGEMYRELTVNGQRLFLPRPFMFSMRAEAGHPDAGAHHVLVMYDNAGEHFYPEADAQLGGGPEAGHATRHLSRSSVLFFLFDPLQDPRFRQKCRDLSQDPQLARPADSACRQETILREAAARIRRELNIPLNSKHTQPLVVVVSKWDVWGRMLGVELEERPWGPIEGGKVMGLRRKLVGAVSTRLRELLLTHCPEVVTAAESFAQQVVYIPVSALGTSPTELEGSEGRPTLGVRAGSIAPIWSAVPMLYALGRWAGGIVARAAGDTGAIDEEAS